MGRTDSNAPDYSQCLLVLVRSEGMVMKELLLVLGGLFDTKDNVGMPADQ